MLAAFPASGTQGELAAMAFIFAVEGLSDYAVSEAAKEFIKGTVKDHDRRFAPSTAVFAERARLHERIAESAAVTAAKRPDQIENQELPEAFREEMRRRIAALPSLKRIEAA